MKRIKLTKRADALVKKLMAQSITRGISLFRPDLAKRIEQLTLDQNKSYFDYQRDAVKGSMKALKLLGDCYRDGIGTKQSARDAFACYNQAAMQGYEPAIFEIGKCYLEGIGVDPNLEAACKHFAMLIPEKDREVFGESCSEHFQRLIKGHTTSTHDMGDEDDMEDEEDEKNDDAPTKQQYVGQCCYADTISSFMETDRNEWLEEMIHQYSSTSPYPLDVEQKHAWEDAYHVLMDAFRDLCDCDDRYGALAIVFEYVMPIRNPSKASIKTTVGYRCDAVIVSSETVIAIEFKQWKDFPKGRKLERQADKYRKRLKRWHMASAGLTKKALFVPTKASNLNLKIGRVRVCSPDNLAQAIHDCFEYAPQPFCSLQSWLDSEWQDRR